jgi:adenylate cyclase class IV
MQNIEIKCRYEDLALAERLARDEVGAARHGRLEQTDTYFNIRPGRLKLRHTRGDEPERFELIFYRRWNRPAAMTSDYQILPVADGPRTLDFFRDALGVKVEVKKSRLVYLNDNLRIHLDTVEGRGSFLELELIVTPAHPADECRARMQELVGLLQIRRDDQVQLSYSDLLLRQGRG